MQFFGVDKQTPVAASVDKGTPTPASVEKSFVGVDKHAPVAAGAEMPTPIVVDVDTPALALAGIEKSFVEDISVEKEAPTPTNVGKSLSVADVSKDSIGYEIIEEDLKQNAQETTNFEEGLGL